MELIIALVLFALIVASWLFLPGSPVEEHEALVSTVGAVLPVQRPA